MFCFGSQFVRINQDELGSRWACEEKTREALQQRKCVIVDRCNFDASQRRRWLEIAQEARVPMDCIVFQIPLQVCIERCEARANHETINPQQASDIVTRMFRQFSPPTLPPLPTESNSNDSSNNNDNSKISLDQQNENRSMYRSIAWIRDGQEFQDLLLEYLNK